MGILHAGPGLAAHSPRPSPSQARVWLLLLGLASASCAVYVMVFTLPMWLPDRYQVPHLDTPTMLGVDSGAAFRFAGAVAVLFALYVAAYRVSFALRSRFAALAILALGVLPCLALLPMYPGGAGDVFTYVAEADIVLHYHSNPFTTTPSSFPGLPLLPYVDYPDETTHYGPLWLVIGVLLRLLSGGNLLASLLAFKAAAALSLMGIAGLVYLTLRRTRPETALSATLLVAWNPLLLFEMVGNGHNDAAMMLLATLALYLYERHLPRLAVAALLSAALVKYAVAILLPLLLVAILRRSGRPVRRWLPGAALYGAGVVALGALLIPTVGIEGTVGVLDKQSRWFTTSAAAVVHLWLLQSMTSEQAAWIASTGAQVLFGALYLVELVRVWRQPDTLAAAAFWAVLALLLVAVTWYEPWYVIWAVPLGALASTRTTRVAAMALTFGAFSTHVVMGFAWRLDWNRGSPIAIHAAGALVAWLPMVIASSWAWLRRADQGVDRRFGRQL